MNRLIGSVLSGLALLAATVVAQTDAAKKPAPAATSQKPETVRAAKQPLVEFEMMTWPEVKQALESGKTTALIYTGGTEQRGPQNVNGGHNLMARATVKAIAVKLGNAIAMPVLPYTPNNASAQLPGTIGLTPEILSAVLERLAEESIKTGFKNVILMSDHGGGQPQVYSEVAKRLDDKYSPQGIHVYFCDEVYRKANDDFDAYLESKGFPRSSHAGIPDTSEMLYLGGNDGWVRKELVKTALGDPAPPPGQRGQRGQRGQPPDPNAPARLNNGITGDARPSTAELGKKVFDLKVDYAVRQIQGFLRSQKATAYE
jgi:creatinine amidohydrolase